MATVSQTIPNYYGGLSEQPDELKIPGQVNKLINTLPDITQGLIKRPGGRLIGGSMGSYTTDSKWFHYYRDENEQYIGQIELSSGSVKMWKCDTGAAVPLLYKDSTAIKNYLKQTSNADAGNIQTLTLNDSTFITNRTVTTAMKTGQSDLAPDRPAEAFLELKKVAYSSQYAVDLFDSAATTTVTTATRIEVVRDVDSSNSCHDTNFGWPSAGTLPGSTGYTKRCNNQTATDPDHDDDVMPNVGTKIFAISSGTTGTASDANDTAWDSTVRDVGNNIVTDRSNLFFRITNTGQPIAQGNDATPEYYSRYTTTHDMLYGGAGWKVGDYFYVWLKNARYTVTIKQISTSKIQCNLGNVRPEPTSFDSKTVVTAESILGALRSEIVATGNFADADVQQIGNGLYITKSSSFNVATPVNDLLNVFTNSVKDIEDLPSQCKNGYIVRIANSVAEEDDYYVKFIGSNGKDGEGVWEECAEPGRKIAFDPATMPVNLVRLSNGTFWLTQLNGSTGTDIPGTAPITIPTSTINAGTGVITISNHGLSTNDEVIYVSGSGTGWQIQGDSWFLADGFKLHITKVDDNTFKVGKTQGATETFASTGNNSQYIQTNLVDYTASSWDNCLVGDDVTVQEPSFIGKGINKMLFFRNRMVMLSDENVIMSRPGSFFNFWPKTAVTYTSTDNIDISCSSEFPAIIYDGIQVNTGLLLFTNNQQFMLTTDSDVLSPNTAKINSLCTYNFNSKTNPISMGTTVAFLDNGGKFSRFFEISAVQREGQPEVLEQSKAVSRSFPKDIDIVANSRENSIVLFAKSGDSKVYGYRYFSGVEKRVQQAWFQWELSGDIQHMAMLDDALYVAIRNRGVDVLQKFSLKIDDESNTWVDDRGTLTDDSDDLTHRIHLDNAYVVSSANLLYDSNSNLTAFVIPNSAFKKTITDAGTAPTYSRSSGSSIVTITYTNHGFKVGQIIHVEYISGSLNLNAENTPAKNATILTASDNSFTIDSQGTSTTSGEATLQALSAVMIVATGDDKKFDGYTQRTRIQDSSGSTLVLMNGNWKTYESGGSTITPTNSIIFGYLFDMEVGFPTIYKQDRVGETSYKADVHSSLILHRVKLSLGPSSVFDIIAKKTNKDTYTESFAGLDPDEVVTDRPVILPDQKVTIPLYEKNINLELSMKSTHASPATLYSLTWEGDYTDAYYQRV